MAELVDATDSKSVELRFMSVRVGLGVPSRLNVSKYFRYVRLFSEQIFDSNLKFDRVLYWIATVKKINLDY